MALIIIIVFIGIVVGGVIAVKRTLNKLDQEAVGIGIDTSGIRCAQDFLPFDKIEDNLIDLGGFKYRKIIECTSINYHLKTEMEKNMIEASFSRFLNSFQFPITFYVQTREMNLTKYLEHLRENIDETIDTFPQLKGYAETFYSEMNRLPELIGNSKQKKKYIIVSYDEANKLESLNSEEKRNYAINELNLRVQMVIDGLSGLGIKASELNTAGLLELMYTTYHKDDFSNFENLLDGEYTSLIVGMDIVRDENTGKLVPYINRNSLSEMNNVEKTENALWNAKNVINNEILSQLNLSAENQDLYKAVIDRLDEIAEQLKEISINSGGNQ